MILVDTEIKPNNFETEVSELEDLHYHEVIKMVVKVTATFTVNAGSQ